MKPYLPPLPSTLPDPNAVYWLKLFDCPGGWAGLVHLPDAPWKRLVRCDDPDDAPVIAGGYKQGAQHNMGSVYFCWTDVTGVPHHA